MVDLGVGIVEVWPLRATWLLERRVLPREMDEERVVKELILGGWAAGSVGDGGTRTSETGSSSRSVSVVIVDTIARRQRCVGRSRQMGW
jgi:hypothetical protein